METGTDPQQGNAEMTYRNAHQPYASKSQAAAIMQAFRAAEIEDAHDAHRKAALRAAMTAKITNWSRA